MSLNAEYYRNCSSLQTRLAKEILKKLVLSGLESILDIGCGDGRITSEVASLIPHGTVLGIDPSPSMIALAKESFSSQSNLAFEICSAEDMAAKTIDVALLFNTLHWIRDPFKTFKNIFESLKPQGQLYILTYPKESPYWEFLDETVKEKKWSGFCNLSASHTMLYSDEYLQLLKQAGLEVIESTIEEQLAIYQSGKELMDYIRGWLACYLPLPKRFEESFLENAVFHAERFYFNRATNQIEIPYIKQLIHCKKL